MLVVDDDEDVREMLRAVLEREGYDVSAASNGAEAVVALHSPAGAAQPPCLILLDLMMPVMDGAMFRRVLDRDPVLSSIPVIVISAVCGRAAAESLRATATLRKPFLPDEVLAAIAAIEQRCPPAPVPAAAS